MLANSAMPGLIKIGRTARSPAERALELSGATGLPTPFIVVYQQMFADCAAAEQFVHTHLAQRGFRVSENREFFNVPPNEAARAISRAPGAVDEPDHAHSSAAPDRELAIERHTSVWRATFDDAVGSYYGLGDILLDHAHAFALFRQAAALGGLPAYPFLGRMCLDGDGTTKSAERALEYFKEGAQKGAISCYFEMGRVFFATKQLENAEKCFSSFSRRLGAGSIDGVHLTIEQLSSIYLECFHLLLDPLSRYVLPTALMTFIVASKQAILSAGNSVLEHAQKKKHLDNFSAGRVESVTFVLDYIEALTEP
ncbi:GIY-YIG nuclease family protein [Paraburkholderia dipogonis]|uniref:GIY-YIG nuclease family protein n=1 Tax=Paraburkholderia dipogonis TaxID=1211383 RepID=UPI0035E9EE18